MRRDTTQPAPSNTRSRRWAIYLGLVLLLATIYVLIGGEIQQEFARHRAINRINKLGGRVQCVKGAEAQRNSIVISWLRLIFGADSFTEAQSAMLNPRSESDLELLKEITEAKGLSLDCSQVSAESIAALWSHFSLESLGLRNSNIDGNLLAAESQLQELRFLHLESCKISNAALRRISKLPKLLSLEFRNCFIEQGSLAALADAQGLHQLSFVDSSLEDSDLLSWHGSKLPTNLKIRERKVSEDAILALRQANRSWSIDILGQQLEAGNAVQKSIRLPSVDEIPHLESMTLGGSVISNATLSILKDANDLRGLNLENCVVTDEGLRALMNLSKLESVQLRSDSLEGSGLEFLPTGIKRLTWATKLDSRVDQLARFAQLENLILTEANITDDDLQALQSLDHLQNLTLSSNGQIGKGLMHVPAGIVGLELYSGITPDAQAQLGRFEKLEFLLLLGSSISDASCEHLVKLKTVRTIELHRTAISAAGLARLKQSLPDCNIHGIDQSQ